MSSQSFPDTPDVSEALMRECRESGEYIPALFEWYRYVGVLANYFSRLSIDSPTLRLISNVHYSILTGQLNRCSRLMFANATLSSKGNFGETTAILDRHIFETAIKLSWLSIKADNNSFDRFIAAGLKTEIKLKKQLEDQISVRGGEVFPLESRMIDSINNYIAKSGLSESFIISSKLLPNIAQMLEDLGEDKITYTVTQGIGSHHVHGTWVGLFYHYLEEKEGKILPRHQGRSTNFNQYGYHSFFVLKSIIHFVEYIVLDESLRKSFIEAIEHAKDNITDIYNEALQKRESDLSKPD